jgi:crotonobetainyl-CoA:carnitine CoA-transferase CaiB-like acyl-CoA transferase
VTAESTSGIANFTGYADGPPVRPGGTPFGDIITAYHAAWSILVALEHRDITGKGAFLDLSMIEPCTHQLGEAIVHYSTTGKKLPRMANHDLNTVTSGCYKCHGDDNWVAIATTSEKQWQALIKVMGFPTWAQQEKFRTPELRTANHDEIDSYIGEWTREKDKNYIARLFQDAGVPAGAVLKIPEVMIDRHLLYRGAFEVIQNPPPPEGIGNRLHLAPPWKFSKTPSSTLHPAPFQHGRDNDYVYRQLLSMTDREITTLEEKRVIGAISTSADRLARRTTSKSPDQFPEIDNDFLEKLALR